VTAQFVGGKAMHANTNAAVADSRVTTRRRVVQLAILWGAIFGGFQAVAPLVLWWLAPGTVYALSLALIASIYIGFAVADGRPLVIAVECGVAAIFIAFAVAAITGPVWLLAIGLAGHGLKDLWQHRRQFVAGTRWWAPFCCTVDLVAAALITLAILSGVV
jgi:hypothetical protein